MDHYGRELADAVDGVIAAWVQRCVISRAGGPDAADPALIQAGIQAGEEARRQVGAKLRQLVDTDIDAQATTPLAILRQAVVYPTEVLRSAGVAPADRDRFDQERFPHDIYGLIPANFADVDPSLVGPGLAWGAAKALAHRHRHRSPPTPGLD
ncbi:MAG: hypothetical protein ACYCS7_09605 [Acidimicrobiales bacterium]